jgi:nicotinamide mononucleotide (NMN) deamidase PncC
MATYARADFVDLRVSAVSDGVPDAESIVQQAVEALSPRLDAYVFARDDEDWVVALTRRLGDRDLATVEVGTGGYLALLLGEAPFLRHAELTPSSAQGAGRLALEIRERIGASVGLAVVADEQGDDMHATIGLARGADAVEEVGRTVFRGGDAGRRRAANAALTQLWRSLA